MRILFSVVTGVSSMLCAQTLPSDAEVVVMGYEKKAAAIREKAEKEIQPHLEKALSALQALQDTYCQQKRLDDAVAIRDRIRALRGILPDPGPLSVQPSDIGRTMLFEVTGTTAGSVWGSEVFTSDTSLGAAAVHQGLLKNGEKAVIRVKVIAGQSAYSGSTRNGVTSLSYGPWSVSFTLGRP
jgi:hypothetical protein